MLKVSTLTMGGVHLGLRFTTKYGIYDASIDPLRELGVFNLTTGDNLDLVPHYGMYKTQQEIDEGEDAEDLSESPQLANLVEGMRREEGFKHMFRYLAPYEQSVEQFMNAGWTPVRVQRNDEHNGQHNLIKPDGTQYRGGWIGKGRNVKEVLTKFHFESCFWFIHRGGKPSPEAIRGYANLSTYEGLITYIMSKIPTRYVRTENIDVSFIQVPQLNDNGEVREILAKEFLKSPPYQIRGHFGEGVYDFKRLEIDVDTIKEGLKKVENKRGEYGFTLDLREITMVAHLRASRTMLGVNEHLHQIYDR